jgi:hypothetical protein
MHRDFRITLYKVLKEVTAKCTSYVQIGKLHCGTKRVSPHDRKVIYKGVEITNIYYIPFNMIKTDVLYKTGFILFYPSVMDQNVLNGIQSRGLKPRLFNAEIFCCRRFVRSPRFLFLHGYITFHKDESRLQEAL